MRAWTYPFRRFGWWLRSPERACRVRWCAAETVGYSAWCRTHTDEILAGEKSPELVAALAGLGYPSSAEEVDRAQ